MRTLQAKVDSAKTSGLYLDPDFITSCSDEIGKCICSIAMPIPLSVIREIPAGLRPRQMGESSASIAQSVRFTLKGIGIAMLHIHFPISSLQDVMKSRSS